MKLYEIIDGLNDIDSFIDKETGEIDVAGLDALEVEFTTKVDNIACWIKNLDYEAKAIKEEEQKLSARRKAKEAKVESLKSYLTFAMQRINRQKCETQRNVISFRKSTALIISNDEKIDQRFVEERTTTERIVDKVALKKAIQCGEAEEVGCELVTNLNIQIK